MRTPLPATYTPEEVAEYCHVTRRTVYQWLSDGKLQGELAGPRRWLISRQQIEAFLQLQKQPKPKITARKSKAAAVQPELPSELLPQGSGNLAPVKPLRAQTAAKKSRRR
jgi:excisionase family DNA binding protein